MRGHGLKIALGVLAVGIAGVLLVWLLAGSGVAPVVNDPVQTQQEERAASPPAGAVEQGPKPAPATELKLRLIGIVTTADKRGSALIASDSGEQKLFFVGDQVFGDSILTAIHEDRVEIKSSRGREILRLSRVITEDVPGGRETQNEVSASADNDMSEFFVPATSSSGEFLGYRSSPKNPLPRFQELGLLSSDIITAVHGLPLIRPENHSHVLQRLRSNQFASITFIRDGNKLITITILSDADSKGSN